MRRGFAAIAASMFIAGIAVSPAAAKPRWGAGPPGGTVVDVAVKASAAVRQIPIPTTTTCSCRP